jgi:hypothetical protein
MNSVYVDPRPVNGKTKFVWRGAMTDSYKIADSYQDIPLDLTNYLIIRTREYLLLKNKVSAQVIDPKSWTPPPSFDMNIK